MLRRDCARLLAFAPRLKTSRLGTVGVPFAERVREAWLSSWKNQNRPQSDDGLTGIGESKLPRAETEARLTAP